MRPGGAEGTRRTWRRNRNEKKKKCYVSVNDMIRRLSISRTLAYQLVNGGDLETVRIGRCLHVSEESLDRWLESVGYSKDKEVDALGGTGVGK